MGDVMNHSEKRALILVAAAAATSAGEITAAARVSSPSAASCKYALTILLQPHQSLPDMTRPLCSAQRV